MVSAASAQGATLDQSVDMAFRGAMRRLVSGVAIVATTDGEGQPRGIAMTAFMSLSMDPPSLLLAVNRTASLCDPLIAHGHFSVNIMAWEEADACQAFVSAASEERFSTLGWQKDETGLPIIPSAVANVICRIDQAEPFGSHMVIRGLVEKVMLGDARDPLAFVDGRYGRTSFDG